MKKDDVFRFCPRCAGRLIRKQERAGESKELTCRQCGFTLYNNPVTATEALIVRDGKILFLMRARNPGANSWSLPGGFLLGPEHPIAGLKREVHEEIGTAIRVQRIVWAGNLEYSWQARKIPVVVVTYQGAITGKVRLSPEHLDFGWFPLNRLPKPIVFPHVRPSIHALRRLTNT